MIHTDGRPTIVSGTAASIAAQSREDADQLAREAGDLLKRTAEREAKRTPPACPMCDAPNNEEPAPVHVIAHSWECQCCGTVFAA